MYLVLFGGGWGGDGAAGWGSSMIELNDGEIEGSIGSIGDELYAFRFIVMLL